MCKGSHEVRQHLIYEQQTGLQQLWLTQRHREGMVSARLLLLRGESERTYRSFASARCRRRRGLLRDQRRRLEGQQFIAPGGQAGSIAAVHVARQWGVLQIKNKEASRYDVRIVGGGHGKVDIVREVA